MRLLTITDKPGVQNACRFGYPTDATFDHIRNSIDDEFAIVVTTSKLPELPTAALGRRCQPSGVPG